MAKKKAKEQDANMMRMELLEAIEELERTKGISKDVLYEAMEQALTSAYKRNYATEQDAYVDINRETGEIMVFSALEVVETVEDETSQVSLEEARAVDPSYEIGDFVEYVVEPRDFGRIAAQTARQVVIQKIREAERGLIFDKYTHRVGDIVTGEVQRISNETVFIGIDTTDGILTPKEQVYGEVYKVGDIIKVYLMDVRKSAKGSQLFFSRSHPGFVRALFQQEVPEIEDGIVEIKGISREAGIRTKMAVWSSDSNVDPVGACVGTRGIRVQAVIDELNNEKIDIIPWSDNPAELIENVLKPATVDYVYVDEDERKAFVIVPNDQLSLAIGRSGQNVRLAARVSDYKIDIKTESQVEALEAAGEFNREDPFGYDKAEILETGEMNE